MKLFEMFERHEAKPVLTEGPFRKGIYEWLASHISEAAKRDPLIDPFDLADWFINCFRSESEFDENRFMKWITKGQTGGRYYLNRTHPNLKRGHYDHLAAHVRDDVNSEEHHARGVWFAFWLAELLTNTNTGEGFKRTRWLKACGVEDK